MLRRISCFMALAAATTNCVFASEVTGSIQTSNTITTGIEIQLPCNPTSVSHGTVQSQTCAITCSSGYSLSGNACVLTQSSGGGGGGGGGSSIVVPLTPLVSSVSTGTTTSNTTTPPPTNSGQTIVTTVKFTDIRGHWAQEYISLLARRTIVSNAELFRPEDSLSRAEFIKIVAQAAGWKQTSSGAKLPFADIKKDDWVVPYLQMALERNIIQSASTYRPTDKISRAEVAKILALTLKFKTSTFQGYFSDVPSSHQLWKYIETLKLQKIFEGQLIFGKTIFRPSDPITRSEIAKTIVKAFKLQ